jgi:tetratricopeptide (TPR) repeat protein
MKEARRRFEAALARCDGDQYARSGLGYVSLRDGDPGEAERLWTVVLGAEPDNVDALVGLGLARWRAGDIDAVRQYFRTVLRLQPEHPTALEYLERVGGADPEAAPPDDPADEAWTEGDTELALRLYSDRLATGPGDGTAMLRVALMRAWEEEYGVALALLDALIEEEPRNVEARLARARVRAWSGDIPGAQAEAADVLALQPENEEALESLALFQAWAGEFDQAFRSYEELLAIAPETGRGELQEALTLALVARTGASRSAYDALLARDPDDVEARLGLARFLAVSEDFAGAIAQYDEVLARAPDEMRARTGKSTTLAWAGRLVESERVALQAVEADGSSAAAWSTLGQVYRWQSRQAAALEALETAAELAPTDATIRDQVRSLRLAMAPVARPRIVYEDDSDGNVMVTTFLTATWHPVPRLHVRADAYRKSLEQTFPIGRLERTAQGATFTGRYQLRPGWTVSGGLGGSRSSGTGDPSALEYRVGLRTPDRSRVGGGVSLAWVGLNETAALAEGGVRSRELSMTGRWTPAPGWRLDGTVSLGRFEGSGDNGRRGASLVASRRIHRSLSIGTSLRGFSFEKDLNDGYFDPDFYGIGEITGRWLHSRGPWTFLVELAPGIQQVGRDGDATLSGRSNVRVAYGLGPGREVSLSFGYSSAGLMSFASGASGYRYTALVLGSSWVF